MANSVFFSFAEEDRTEVLMIKGRAMNPIYPYLYFRVSDLLARWDTQDPAVIRQAISKSIFGASRTIVFVGFQTCKSYWVSEEVRITSASGKPVFAIRIKGSSGVIPHCLSSNGIHVYDWSEQMLQRLATV